MEPAAPVQKCIRNRWRLYDQHRQSKPVNPVYGIDRASHKFCRGRNEEWEFITIFNRLLISVANRPTMIKSITYLLGVLSIGLFSVDTFAQKSVIDQKVDALLAKMTLDEKIGQLNQYNGDWEATGPLTKDVGNKIDEIKKGRVGAVLNIMGTMHTRTFQEA